MPVCRNKKIIFIHIPKNAGESIEKSLNIYNGGKVENIFGINNSIVLQHLTAIQLKNSYFDNLGWWSFQMNDLDQKIDRTASNDQECKASIRLKGFVKT